MISSISFAWFQNLEDEGLTFADILDSLPTDPASLIAVLLMVGFVGLIVYYGTRSGKPGGDAPEPPAPERVGAGSGTDETGRTSR